MSLRVAFSLVLVLFFSWGFLTALNDVLVTDFRALFSLSYRAATLVQFTFFLSCFVASFPCGSLVGRAGHKATMLAGLAGMCLGALCFVAASTTAHFSTFLAAIVVMAFGSTALQTAAGPYVSLMRPDASGASQFSLALAVNSMGAMLAPAFGALFLLRRTTPVHPQSLGPPFAAIAAALFGLCILVSRARLANCRLSQHGQSSPGCNRTQCTLLPRQTVLIRLSDRLTVPDSSRVPCNSRPKSHGVGVKTTPVR